MDWVEKAAVRLREHGRVLTGDVFVVPKTEENLVERIEQASAELEKLDWRLHDLRVTPVARIDGEVPPRVGPQIGADKLNEGPADSGPRPAT
jgi:hypothetical protein